MGRSLLDGAGSSSLKGLACGGTSLGGLDRGSSYLKGLVWWWCFRGGDGSWFFLSRGPCLGEVSSVGEVDLDSSSRGPCLGVVLLCGRWMVVLPLSRALIGGGTSGGDMDLPHSRPVPTWWRSGAKDLMLVQCW